MRHFVLPDVQQKPGCSTEHLSWAGQYCVDMKPDKIICIGDFWDMPSLSSFDRKGGRLAEGRRYNHDIDAGREAMDAFLAPIRAEQKRLKRNKDKRWKPEMVYTMGNHEYRIERAIDQDAMMEGLISMDDFGLEADGWDVVPFLEVQVLDGVCYSHYFTSGVMGRPVSSARLMLTKKHMSCVMGHVQDRDIAFAQKADGTNMTGIFAGIYYQHDEEYLTAQTNGSWRGVWILNDVVDGSFDEMPVSLKYLKEKYS